MDEELGPVVRDPDCCLDKPGPDKTPWNQCCCKCKFHLPIHEHCCTNPKLADKKGRCICHILKGWACAPPGFGRIYDKWPKHGEGCEMYQEEEEKGGG